MKSQRKATVVGLAATLFVLAGLAAAWACTATPTLQIMPAIGMPGSKISATSQNAPGTLEIRWNSAEGPLVGTGQGASPSVEFAVPTDAAPGVYYIVAIQKDNKGTPLGKISSSFEVTDPGGQANSQASPVSQDLWSAYSADSGSTLGSATTTEPTTKTPGPALMAGMALATAGAASLLSLTVVGLRRRRTAS